MRSESEFQRIKSATETRERDLERLDAEPGDAVRYDGETWFFLEVRETGRGPVCVLEQWDDMAEASPGLVSAKN